MPTISELYVYPLKSCRGIALDRATVTATGFAHDREWLIVQSDGRFITQREEPRLALIAPTLTDTELLLAAPGRPTLAVAIAAATQPTQVTCWGDRCAAFDGGEPAARWLSEFLNKAVRLVRFDPRHKRTSNPRWTGDLEALNQFSDGYPWMLISMGSLAALNQRLEQPLPVNRFRPNIVLSGLDAHEEDRVHELASNGVRLRAVKPCTRCIITTTEQATGARDGVEPLRTLRTYRFSSALRGVLFGQNLALITGVGQTLAVGDRLEVTWKQNDHCT